MKRLLLMAVAVFIFAALGFAQGNSKTCRGTVIDELGEPLIGATVQVKGTTTAVPTDIDGNFSIKV
ncbi:MAG: carboxypeptidase-like regulatory domain-containing protein, partial [Muribaculaceae bacterium]|nr:carboxypeptidase-like regulatory domain-containing protein [Muribaculaceae bacterium]